MTTCACLPHENSLTDRILLMERKLEIPTSPSVNDHIGRDTFIINLFFIHPQIKGLPTNGPLLITSLSENRACIAGLPACFEDGTSRFERQKSTFQGKVNGLFQES